MAKQRFEFAQGSSAKFWEVEAKGTTVTVRYGRIGTTGQEKKKDHQSPAAARTAAAKLIGQKIAKGYAEVAAGAASARKAVATKATTKAKTKAKTKAPAKKATKKTAVKAADTPARPKRKAFSKLSLKRIFKAIERGQTKELMSALAKGLDPDARHPDKRSPLFHLAVRADQLDTAATLLTHGASPKATDAYGRTPLHCAVAQPGAETLVKLLIEAGADVNAKAGSGRTPLFGCEPELMPLLVEAGAKIDVKDKEKESPYGTGNAAQREMLRRLGAKGFTGAGGRALTPKKNDKPKLEKVHRTEGIGKAADGAIWLASYDGYHRFTKKGVTQFVFRDSFAPGGFARGKAGAIYFESNWGLVEFKRGKWRIYEPANSEIHCGHLVEIASDPDGRVYCRGYDDPHISVFDGKSWTLLRPGHELPPEADFEIRCMGFTEDGSMLLGSRNDGALRRSGNKWKELKLHDKALGTPAVYGFATMDGAIYVACVNGIVRVTGNRTKHYEPDDVSLITALAPAGDGVLWASGDYDGLVRLAGGKLSYFREEDHELLDGGIGGVVVDDDGLLWLHDGKTILTFDGHEVRKAGGVSFAEASPKRAAAKAKKKAQVKALEKTSKHVRARNQ